MSVFARSCEVHGIIHITAAFGSFLLEICWNKFEMKIRLCDDRFCRRHAGICMINNERFRIMMRQLAQERSVATIACCL